MKYKKILMIGLIGVLSIGTLVGCKNKTDHSSKNTTETVQDIDADNQDTEINFDWNTKIVAKFLQLFFCILLWI